MILALLIALVFMLAVMAAAWAAVLKTANGGWTDVFWTFGTGAAGVIVSLTPWDGAPGPRQWLVAALVALWAIRLGSYIGLRVARGGVDPRYEALRDEWGPHFARNLFGLAITQAPTTALLCASIAAAALRPGEALGPADHAGAAILLIAIAGEGLADGQMKRFRTDPANRGKVMDKGLWALSRHPNYFFEWFGWLAYPVMAVDLTGVYPAGWASLIAPVAMYLILRHLTGVPPLERAMIKSRGDEYRDYQARVGALFPRLTPSHKRTAA